MVIEVYVVNTDQMFCFCVLEMWIVVLFHFSGQGAAPSALTKQS